MTKYYNYWKEEERVAKWKVCLKGKEPPSAMFATSMCFIENPKWQKEEHEKADLLNVAVQRFGPLTLDFDSKDAEESRIDAIACVEKFISFGVDPKEIKLYYSGSKGFHVCVSPVAFGAEKGHKVLPLIYKSICKELFPIKEVKTLDRSMFAMSRGKMFRLPNKKRENGRHKIRLTWQELKDELSMSEIEKMALQPREEWPPKKGVQNSILSKVFMKHEVKVIETIKKQTEALCAQKTPILGDKKLPPCLLKILSFEEKPEDYEISYNQICFSAIVPALKASGFTKEEAFNLPEVEQFLNNFQGSSEYQSPRQRYSHLEDMWDLDEKSPREFSCGAMWSTAGKDWGTCLDCEIYLEDMFSDINSTKNEENPDKKEKKEEKIPNFVKEINKNFAFTVIGSKSAIIHEFEDGEYSVMTTNTFHELLSNKISIDNRGKTPKKIYLSKLWMDNEHRRMYRKIGFFPKDCPADTFNTWRGFAVKNALPDLDEAMEKCKLYRSHVEDVICKGNQEIINYVWAWLANLIQDPGSEKPGVAIVLRGEEGAGKGIFAKPLGDIIGFNHYAETAKKEHFFSQFNTFAENKLLVFLDEIVWGGNKHDEGVLKSLITSERQTVERKGFQSYDILSYTRYIMSSNEDWVVPAGRRARRYLVLDVSDKHAQDSDVYFKNLRHEISNGGVEGLYTYLLNYDYSKINLRKVPSTEALQEQKELSLGSVETWWREILENGHLPRGAGETELIAKLFEEQGDWPDAFDPDSLYGNFLDWCKRTNQSSFKYVSRNVFIRRLLKMQGTTAREARKCRSLNSNSQFVYGLQNFETSLELFQKATGIEDI